MSEADTLTERLTANTLGQEPLLLAAYLGHAPAREAAERALGPSAVPDLPDAFQGRPALVRRVYGLERWGQPAWARAAAAIGAACVTALERAGPVDAHFASALAALEAWLACPCPDHELACSEAAYAIASHSDDEGYAGEQEPGRWRAIFEAIANAPRARKPSGVATATDLALDLLGADPLETALREALVSWALK